MTRTSVRFANSKSTASGERLPSAKTVSFGPLTRFHRHEELQTLAESLRSPRKKDLEVAIALCGLSLLPKSILVFFVDPEHCVCTKPCKRAD